jgi:hypothetical protein
MAGAPSAVNETANSIDDIGMPRGISRCIAWIEMTAKLGPGSDRSVRARAEVFLICFSVERTLSRFVNNPDRNSCGDT